MALRKKKQINLMEVCGTHTMAIARNGLRGLFPPHVRMLSGPGCPVCVTPTGDIDIAIQLAGRTDVILSTFGDMLHVPGSASSLEREKARGADIRVVYSPVDALDIARDNPAKEVVFIGVGFETTAPAIAATVLIARKRKIRNFSVVCLCKTVPNALRLICGMDRRIDGFLLPGHVSAIIGAQPYDFIAREFGIPAVISGFEPGDILDSVARLVEMIERDTPKIDIQYTRAVRHGGNRTALKLLEKVFDVSDARWRSIGVIPGSGLALKRSLKDFDAVKRFGINPAEKPEPRGCQCGKILLGLKTPRQCTLFGRACTPSLPIGPCMVSSEGSCAAEFKYGKPVSAARSR